MTSHVVDISGHSGSTATTTSTMEQQLPVHEEDGVQHQEEDLIEDPPSGGSSSSSSTAALQASLTHLLWMFDGSSFATYAFVVLSSSLVLRFLLRS